MRQLLNLIGIAVLTVCAYLKGRIDGTRQMRKSSVASTDTVGNTDGDESTDDDKEECDECGKEFKNEHGLSIHKGRMH